MAWDKDKSDDRDRDSEIERYREAAMQTLDQLSGASTICTASERTASARDLSATGRRSWSASPSRVPGCRSAEASQPMCER